MADDQAAQQQQNLATNRALEHAREANSPSQGEVSSGGNVGNGGGGAGITPGITSFGENSIELFSPENCDSLLGEMKKGCMSGSAIDGIADTFEHSGPMQGVDKISQEVTIQPHFGQAVAPPTAAQDFQIKKAGLFGREGG